MLPELNTVANVEVQAALIDLSRSCVTLAKLLQRGANLTDRQRLSIENCLAIVQLNYAVWIRESDSGIHR